MTPEQLEAFNNILDCFSGSDGGTRFLKLRYALDDMSKQTDNKSSQEILLIMTRFSHLIDIAEKMVHFTP